MASVIYNSCIFGVFRSMIRFDTDMFKMILVGSTYTPDKTSDKVRSDVEKFEVSDSDGYMQGGKDVDTTIVKNDGNNNIEVILNGATWDFATITAGGAVYYKVRGSPSLDDLICYVQFNQPVSSKDGNFVVTPSRIRIQN